MKGCEEKEGSNCSEVARPHAEQTSQRAHGGTRERRRGRATGCSGDRGGGSPRATAKRPVAPRGSVTPDKEARGGGGEERGRKAKRLDEETGGRREARGEAPAPSWRSRLGSPRAGTVWT